MTITIRCFATLRDCGPLDGRRITLSDGATALEAWTALVAVWPGLAPWLACVRPAVNQAYAPWRTPLRDGDELALIPPVSGG